MALARSRAAARRVKDRWKAKTWFQVTAPASFSNKLLAETLSDEPEKLIGRRVETSMFDLTGDMKQMHIKINFQVSEVTDRNAKTVFDGHTMTSDYVRRLTRRGSTKIPAVFDVQTKDGSRVRVKPFAIADRRCQTTQAQQIRKVMEQHINDAAKANTLSGLLADILVGDLTTRMYKDARKIHPVRRIEIAKTEVLKAPAVEMDETPIVKDEPEPQPVETTDADSEEEADASETGADDSEE